MSHVELFNLAALLGGGTITRVFQRTQPSWMLSSASLDRYGLRSSELGVTLHWTSSRTLAKTGSLAVQAFICAAVTTEASSASISKMVSPGSGTRVGVSGSGRRLKRSLEFSVPALN